MIKLERENTVLRLASWLLFAMFMVFSTPTPMVESAGESAASGLRGTEFHTHVQSRSPDVTASKARLRAPRRRFWFLLAALIFPVPALPFRIPAYHRARMASVLVMLRKLLLNPVPFSSTLFSSIA